MSSKVELLQAAVRSLLEDVQMYQESENITRIREDRLYTLEDYGLKEEDMKP